MTFKDFLKKLFRSKKPEEAKLVEQNAPARYLDERKLDRLLTELFGRGNYRIGMKEEQWILSVPRMVTNDELS